MKSPFASKTLWVNTLMLLALLLASPAIEGMLPGWTSWGAGALAAVNIVLRFFTDTAIGTPPSVPGGDQS